MDFAFLSIIFGIISIILSISGLLSLIFSIPGLIFAYLALKGNESRIPFYIVQKKEGVTKFIKETPKDPKKKLVYLGALLNLAGVALTFVIYYYFFKIRL